MGVSKVVYGNRTLIDLTGDTVTAGDLALGVTAHGADVEAITGTSTYDTDSGRNSDRKDGVCEQA